MVDCLVTLTHATVKSEYLYTLYMYMYIRTHTLRHMFARKVSRCSEAPWTDGLTFSMDIVYYMYKKYSKRLESVKENVGLVNGHLNTEQTKSGTLLILICV